MTDNNTLYSLQDAYAGVMPVRSVDLTQNELQDYVIDIIVNSPQVEFRDRVYFGQYVASKLWERLTGKD